MSFENLALSEINGSRFKKLFREIGLYNTNSEFYKQRAHKHQQVFSFILQIRSVLSKLSQKRPIVMLDCGCGRSYLSFILYEYCTKVLFRDVKIIGVDSNEALIRRCIQAAQDLKYTSMEFHCAPIDAFAPSEPIDIVYSLHACNTATDQALAKAIELEAKHIFSVSCCQHRNRNNLSEDVLRSISRHCSYKERLADMIGDSMRALLLEHFGYGIKLFEFTAAKYTPKNIMLRAERGGVRKVDQQNAMIEYRKLVDMFHFSTHLEDLTLKLSTCVQNNS
jgi:trans-aconitate methyltransferase